MTPRQRFLAVRAAYVAIALLATLTDLELSPDLTAAAGRAARALVPAIGWRDFIDGLRNLALFAGLGGVWMVTSTTPDVRRELGRATLAGFTLGALAESAQVFSPVRTASVLDLITNTLGALVGAVAMAVLILLVRSARGKRSYLGVPTSLLAGAYGLAVMCEALIPLFSSIPVRAEGGPLTRLSLMLQLTFPLSIWEIPLVNVALFLPAGALAVMVLAEAGRSPGRDWVRVAVIGAALMIVLELAHGALGLPIRWEAAATNAVAVGLGAWMARRWLAPVTQVLRGAERARYAIFAGTALLAGWGWRPFLPEAGLRLIRAKLTTAAFIPLASLAQREDVFSAVHVFQQCLLYIPLGAMLAVWPLRLQGRWSNLWPAVWLALLIEMGHLVIATRFFDMTNVLLAWAGLGIGWIVHRRSGYAPYGEALPAAR